MERRQKTVLALRWVQWLLGLFSFGVLFAYFLMDINFYMWIPTMNRAQLAISGIVHVYLYLAAIWMSVKPQGPLVWAVFDIIAILLTAAVAGLSQSNLSTYCSSRPLVWYWSDASFAFVPRDQRASSDKSDLMETIGSSYMTRACGLNGVVAALNVVMAILFITTAILQIRQHREQKEESQRCLSQQEKLVRPRGWRKSLAAPFARRQLNLEN